jgi:ABC-2 type transport system permease protein
MKKGSNKKKFTSWFNLMVGLLIIILLNILGSYVFHRFDLTEEKRYSISDPTRKMLKELKNDVYFQIYLEGDFPGGYKRLRDEFKLMLDQFRAYAGDKIQYSFINPTADPDPVKQRELFTQLIKQGLEPTTLNIRTDDGEKQQIVIPGAMVTMGEKSLPLSILKSQVGVDPDEMLNNSIQNLEYEIAFTIKKLQTTLKKRIAFVEGHGELGEIYVGDLAKSLSDYYTLERVRLNENLAALTGFSAAIIIKPDSAFSEKDKFILDQFVMRGGKLIWMIDPIFASMDSLTKHTVTMGFPMPLNLDDQLFRYGVRINSNLIQDVRSAAIPVITGYVGNQPKQQLYPWYYFPLFFPDAKHPIVKNLNAVKSEFVSGIDTVGNPSIRKTVLLRSSSYSKTQNAPATIDLRMVRKKPNPEEFNKSFLPVAVLLEGKFTSVFKNRLPPEIENASEIRYKSESEENSMIVIADGDIARNQVQKSTGKVFPLGYDRYTNQTYGNKNFLLNCMNYLLDGDQLLTLRNREIRLRLLDRTRLEEERTYWQTINTAVPLGMILLYGIGAFWMRKRKFGK